jgi:hypothetical protein
MYPTIQMQRCLSMVYFSVHRTPTPDVGQLDVFKNSNQFQLFVFPDLLTAPGSYDAMYECHVSKLLRLMRSFVSSGAGDAGADRGEDRGEQ